LETPVVLSQQTVIWRNDACQIILLFCIVLIKKLFIAVLQCKQTTWLLKN
jgi:hypothetical protein